MEELIPYANDPERFSLSINGINLFKDMPAMELRKYTFLVGPNGSGKSTFLRLLPLFGLPEQFHLGPLIKSGFSLGHFATIGKTGPLFDSFEVTVEYDMPTDHWEAPPERLVRSLENYEQERARLMELYEKNEGDFPGDGGGVPELLETVRRYEKGRSEKYSDSSEHSQIRVRVTKYYSVDGDRIIVSPNQEMCEIAMQIDGVWEDAMLLYADEVIDGNVLQHLNLLRVVMRLATDSEDLPLISPGKESHSDSHGEALVDALQKKLAEGVGWFRVSDEGIIYGTDVINWIQSFFVNPLSRRFDQVFSIETGEITNGPIWPIDSFRFPFLPVEDSDPKTNDSAFLKYWLETLGIGSKLRIDFLDSDGWRLLVLRDEQWMNILNLGAGIARMLWLLFVLTQSNKNPAYAPIQKERIAFKVREVAQRLERASDENERDTIINEMMRVVLNEMRPSIDGTLSRSRNRFEPHTVIIEEPEARLHPRFQSLLADILTFTWSENSEVAKQQVEEFHDAINDFHDGGVNIVDDEEKAKTIEGLLAQPFLGETSSIKTFIVETHSEYIIRRLQALIAQGRIDKREAIIFYFNGPSNSNQDENTYPIEFNGDGTLTRDFGPGFFGEAANLIDELWNAWKPKS